jgi:hypothetical protein
VNIRVVRRLLVGVGGSIMAYAVVGLARDHDARPVGHLLFLAGVLAAHDLVLLPLVIAAGVLVGRWVPAAVRPVVVGAGIVSVAVTLAALPLVFGYGRRADDPSALPLPYGRNLLLTLAAVWVLAATVAIVRWIRRRN